MNSKGKLYLIPTLLGSDNWEDVLPNEVIEITKRTRHFAVENIKTARRFLRKIDRDFPIDDSTFFILNKKTPQHELPAMLSPIKNGNNVGIISEAGCPGIADPGAVLVALAQQQSIWVMPLTGPSSILLSLMASGFNGQSFCFHGYVPKERKDRIQFIKKMERNVRKKQETQIFMDTPYRNNHLLEDILNECLEDTLLCIASEITMPQEKIQTLTVGEWHKKAYNLDKKPTMFLLGSYT